MICVSAQSSSRPKLVSMIRFPARFPLRSRRLVALVAGAALASAAGSASADPPLWRVIGPHGEVDLFGSIHLLSDATQWKNPALTAVLAKADALWFEIPLGGASQAQAIELMQAKGLLPTGQSLSSLLPAPLMARVTAQAKREGLDLASLERMKPWLAELELTLKFYTDQGYSEKLGVESQINAAVPASVPREAFETLDKQVDLFADDPMPEQVASLKQTLDELDTDPGLFARAASAWRRGDVKAIATEIVAPMRKEDEALYRRVLVDRNHRFARRIEALAKQPGRVFVVVGVGHLVGPDGVPALLRKDGLDVEGP